MQVCSTNPASSTNSSSIDLLSFSGASSALTLLALAGAIPLMKEREERKKEREEKRKICREEKVEKREEQGKDEE
ncbi:unnamed protein product [Trifolium pratense]|uniref:Uncharacterized protein n=1 Tax=Trifolium pratense TaxID=57577 RepID=A0ACB0JGR2_TRIPR|nr:unnamed protein product [Trifolium pratense]